MATTLDGSGSTLDPRGTARNNGLYWGIAAAIVVLLAIMLTRPVARDNAATTNTGTTMSSPDTTNRMQNTNTGTTEPATTTGTNSAERTNVNGAATGTATGSTMNNNTGTTETNGSTTGTTNSNTTTPQPVPPAQQ